MREGIFKLLTAFEVDLNDDIQQGALITHEGNVTHARTREALDKR